MHVRSLAAVGLATVIALGIAPANAHAAPPRTYTFSPRPDGDHPVRAGHGGFVRPRPGLHDPGPGHAWPSPRSPPT